MPRSFTVWMKQIDNLLLRTCGLTHEDLPDLPYRDLFDCEESPIRVARMALDLA